MEKPWIITEVYNHAEQRLLISPTPEFNAIQIYIQEANGEDSSGAFYINKGELPVIIEKLKEMMNYVENK